MIRLNSAAMLTIVWALAQAPASAQAPANTQAPAKSEALASSAAPADAQAPPAAQSDDPKDVRVALLKRLPPGSKLEDLHPSPIPGIYEFSQGTDVSYITVDGKYFIDGNIYDMETRANLTEALRTHARVALIGAVPESQMVIFSPDKPHYTITVFTDVDCAYCRKLHSEIAELNRLGVRVRYVFYPRTGPGTESWHKAEAVWCAANRNEALTQAKAGAVMDLTKTCGATPVAREFELGQAIGVRGTPAIVTEAGDLIEGYMPPHDLVQQLKTLQVAQR